MTATQKPGDQERDRLAEEYADNQVAPAICPGISDDLWRFYSKINFKTGWDKAMEQATQQLFNQAQTIEEMQAEVKRLTEALESIIERRYEDCHFSIAKEALAPRREGE